MGGNIDKKHPSKKLSKVVAISTAGSVTEGDIEDEINPILEQGFQLIAVSSFANKVWAIFTKVNE